MACGSSDPSPSDAVEQFFDLVLEGNLDDDQVLNQMSALTTGKIKERIDSRKRISKFKKISKTINEANGSIETDGYDIDGSEANVTLLIVGEDDNGEEIKDESTVELRSENGQWLIYSMKGA
ncbi:hypothetical protein A3729_18475 [Oleiphilus sp. HI0043]|nr:hypothetical protein A3729_18475 [Oleiphilus sp. HI0043]KZZ66994.1 hypothetical protein A3763_16700 [Oleiphilus sp. HI0128]KZZ70111.1 hypothetical protein A3763_26215 [Oleiphilus sp. HI0128]